MAIEQAPIVPPPTLPGMTQNPGTYPNEKARQEASLAAFHAVVEQYPATPEGAVAQYHEAMTLLALGRFADADKAFQAVIDRDGKSIFAAMSRMGRAEVLLQSGKYDDAIKAFSDLSGDRDGLLPVDGVLMQLAQAYQKAGKTQDARATYKRVADEFPQSPFAADARTQVAGG
jgi:TolA-binding protein